MDEYNDGAGSHVQVEMEEIISDGGGSKTRGTHFVTIPIQNRSRADSFAAYVRTRCRVIMAGRYARHTWLGISIQL